MYKQQLLQLQQLVTDKQYDLALQQLKVLRQSTNDRTALVQLQQIELNINRLLRLGYN
jgi:hypothetical protein